MLWVYVATYWVIVSQKSLSKRLSGDVVEGGQSFDNSVLGELLFVRYMGVAMKECGGDVGV